MSNQPKFKSDEVPTFRDIAERTSDGPRSPQGAYKVFQRALTKLYTKIVLEGDSSPLEFCMVIAEMGHVRPEEVAKDLVKLPDIGELVKNDFRRYLK